MSTEPRTAVGPQRGLARVLGFWGTASVSIGVMAPTLAMSIVGPGAAGLVGRAAPLAFGLAGLVVLLVSAGFLRLSAEFAHAGSVYAFVGRSIGPRTGVFTGWAMLGTYLVFPWVSVAGIAVFGGAFLDVVGLHVDWYGLALGGWLVVGGLAAGRIRATAGTLIAFEAAAVALILALMAVVVGTILSGRAPRGQRITPDVLTLPDGVPFAALVLAVTAAFLAFCGFEAAGSMGEEARAPLRAVPRAMLLTIALGTVFYVACTAVQTWGFGTDAAGTAAFAGSAAPLGELALLYAGPPLAAALYAVALVSAVGAGLGCALVAVRMLFAFARDGLLPAALARVSRAGVPTTALGCELGMGIVLITAFRLAGAAPMRMFFVLATIGVLLLLVMYTITNLAAGRRLRGTGAGWQAVVPPLVGAGVAAAVVVYSAVDAPVAMPLVVAAWLALGLVFLLARRGRLSGVPDGPLS